MEGTAATTKGIINHHLEAFLQKNLADLLHDYSDQAEIWTPDGILAGKEAISTFYAKIFAVLPSGSTTLDVKQMIIAENKAYLVWSADSPFVHIPLGTDSLEVKNGKIVWQSLAAQIIQK